MSGERTGFTRAHEGTEGVMDEQLGPEQALEGIQEGLQELLQAHARTDRLLGKVAAELSESGVSAERMEGRLSRQEDALETTRQEVSAVAETVKRTHDAFENFVERYGRHQIVAGAQAELTRLTVVWKGDYAHRKQTRDLARGLVHALTAQAVESGLVDTATIEACTRERLLTEPTYWLAPATMAVAARYRDDPGNMLRATAHAVHLDPAKAKLFFALTSSRLGRQGEAASWMDRYLGSLDRDRLGPEFTVVLDALANAEIGHEAYTYAREAMARWFREDPAVFRSVDSPVHEHLERWRLRLEALGGDGSLPRHYPALRKLCGGNWRAIEQSWRGASAVGGTFSHLTYHFSEIPRTSARKGRYTDSALDHLIDQLETDESELQTRMAGLHALIDHEGDLAAASKSGGVQEPEALNFGTLMEQAVFEPTQLSLGTAGRQLALSCVWDSIQQASLALADQSRSLMPATITLKVEDWSCAIPTRPSSPFSGDRAKHELVEHVERRTLARIESVVPLWTLTWGCTVLAVLDGVLLAMITAGAALFCALLVLLVCTALWGLAHVPFRRHSLREDGARRRTEGLAVLTQALHEAEELLDEWQHGLAAAEELASWTPSSLPDGER